MTPCSRLPQNQTGPFSSAFWSAQGKGFLVIARSTALESMNIAAIGGLSAISKMGNNKESHIE
jgi:hypothetical protein